VATPNVNNANRPEKSKRSIEIFTFSMEILVSGGNHCLQSCVFTLHVEVLGQSSRYSNVTVSLLPQLTPLAANHHLQACNATA
jgi:hypothetical protein